MIRLILAGVACLVGVVVAATMLLTTFGPDASDAFPREVDQDLVEAAARGDIAGVDAAIAAGADVNAVGRNGIRPLEWVDYRNKVGFEYLLKMGADPSAFNDRGECAVHYTVIHQDIDWLRMVLEHGGDPNLRDRVEVLEVVPGETPLFAAACRSSHDSMELLVAHGADINIVDNSKGYSPLIAAADHGYMLNVKWLLEHGADSTVRTTEGVGLAEAILHHDEYDPEKYPEYAEAYRWILDFLEEQRVDLAEAEERAREIYGPNFRRFSDDAPDD